MRQISDQEVQQVIFDMMCQVADICDANGIRYYLCGGTLLGAVRHRDFIPWDLDADLQLPRPDYLRLVELMRTQKLGPHCEFRCYELGNLDLPYAKVFDLRTRTDGDSRYSQVWIDLFPLDGVPSDPRKSEAFLRRVMRLRRWELRVRWRKHKRRSPWKALIVEPLYFCVDRLLGGSMYFNDRIHRMALSHDFERCEYICEVSNCLEPRVHLKKSEFLPQTDLEFHGRRFHAPANWDDYLRQAYGEYMRLPPPEQRKVHCRAVYWSGGEVPAGDSSPGAK